MRFGTIINEPEVLRECHRFIQVNDHINLRIHIEHDADLISLPDSQGYTLLTIAAMNGAYECAELLIELGAIIDQKGNDGLTPLMFAVGCESYQLSKLLLKCGAEISLRNQIGNSAFDYAKLNNKQKIHKWIELFASYKDQLDEKDMELYHAYRLRALYAPKKK
jgi:ankyrin repeat protein